jgi:hypothetical protein
MPFPPGYGTPAPNSQFGLSAALSMPMIEPSPNIRQGFLIAGIGGGVAFLAYFVFGLPWFWPMWLVPVLAALVGVLGFIPGARNRLYGPLTPRNGAITTIVASALGLLFLLFVWGGFGNFGSWIVALGLLAGIVGGVRVYREAPPASVAAPPSSPLPPMPSPTIQTATDSAQPAPKQKPGGSGEGKNLIVAGLVLVLDLISSAWDLILKIAFVIFVVALAVGFIKSCAGGGLNEHSSCQQFQQADSSAQNKVLQDMMTAHHDQSSVSTARFSVTLYCNIYGGSAPIDGVYSSGDLGQQPAQALHISQRH